MIGQDDLERPYGIAATATGAGEIDCWVTDNFDWDPADEMSRAQLGERIRRYRLAATPDGLEWSLTASFGDTEGRGALHKVESIAVDVDRGVLLIADEEASRMGLRVYTLDGTFSGTVIGEEFLRAEPEGVALRAEGTGGVWIITDQHSDRSVFFIVDRISTELLGSFTGAVTANTDGIALTVASSERFPVGALFAVHDDLGVAAFDWREIRRALEKTGEQGTDPDNRPARQ
jgi:3-phytase